MIELFEQDIRTNDRQSSKGNQLKWKKESIWYKADYLGYEGLAEYLISHLLLKSDLEPSLITQYRTEQIQYQDRIFLGCASPDFLQENEQLMTLERLYKNETGESLYRSVFRIQEHAARLIFLVNQVERFTNIENFGQYIAQLLIIDLLFLNEDRHFHNIALRVSADGVYHFCPVFDMGACLLSDTRMEYPMNGDIYRMIRKVRAKTISDDFEEQADIAEQQYGQAIRFSFTKKDVENLLKDEPYYPAAVKKRVEDILFEQMRKYGYLFR